MSKNEDEGTQFRSRTMVTGPDDLLARARVVKAKRRSDRAMSKLEVSTTTALYSHEESKKALDDVAKTLKDIQVADKKDIEHVKKYIQACLDGDKKSAEKFSFKGEHFKIFNEVEKALVVKLGGDDQKEDARSIMKTWLTPNVIASIELKSVVAKFVQSKDENESKVGNFIAACLSKGDPKKYDLDDKDIDLLVKVKKDLEKTSGQEVANIAMSLLETDSLVGRKEHGLVERVNAAELFSAIKTNSPSLSSHSSFTSLTSLNIDSDISKALHGVVLPSSGAGSLFASPSPSPTLSRGSSSLGKGRSDMESEA